MKNSSDTIGDRTRDLPACTAVSQPTALLRVRPNRFSPGQEIPRILWSLQFHCCVYKRPPLGLIQTQINPIKDNRSAVQTKHTFFSQSKQLHVSALSGQYKIELSVNNAVQCQTRSISLCLLHDAPHHIISLK